MMVFFLKLQYYFTAYNLVLSLSRDFSFGDADSYSFGVAAGVDRGGVDIITTRFSPHRVASSLIRDGRVSVNVLARM